MSESEPTLTPSAESQPKNSDMIEVPDWGKQSPEAGDAGYEAGFDDDPFAKGKEVTVKQTGQNGTTGYTEGGWTIIDDDATVKIGEDKYMVGVVVEKEIEGQIVQKSIPLNELMELNPRAEKEPLSEAQEDVAEVAIEISTGIEDPSEIDEAARNYAPGEMKAMREASRRIVDQEPTIPNLEQVMSSEEVPKAEEAPSELDKQLAIAEAELTRFKDEMTSDKDRQAAWQYANSINYAERDSALNKLSYGFDQTLLQAYTATAHKLLDLRKQAEQ